MLKLSKKQIDLFVDLNNGKSLVCKVTPVQGLFLDNQIMKPGMVKIVESLKKKNLIRICDSDSFEHSYELTEFGKKVFETKNYELKVVK